MKVDWSPLVGKTVMVTGSTGLIGSHLRTSVQKIAAHCYFPARGALLGGELLPKVDYVIHAAGYGVPALFMKSPIETIQVNTETVISLMKCLKSNGSFLFCSTSEIYKGFHGIPSENDIGATNPQHPRSAYIEGKRCGEAIMKAYRDGGIQAKVARINLVYGPGTKVHDGRVLNQLIEQALTTGKIQPRDNCSCTPTYCYIDDMVEMLWNVLLHGTQEVNNLAGIDTLPLSNLAKLVGKLTGAEVIIPKEPVSAPFVTMDTTRYRREFKKRDFVTLRQGMSKTIEYQRGLYDTRIAS